VAADPSPAVSRDGPESAEVHATPRFERYVTRLPDGRRLTLYSRPFQAPTGRDNE
jgi:hypothetical protein